MVARRQGQHWTGSDNQGSVQRDNISVASMVSEGVQVYPIYYTRLPLPQSYRVSIRSISFIEIGDRLNQGMVASLFFLIHSLASIALLATSRATYRFLILLGVV